MDDNLVCRCTRPPGGRIQGMRPQSGNDFKVEVKVNGRFSYYVAHLFLDQSLKAGNAVEGGQLLGTTSGRGSLDLGCIDSDVTLSGFVNPKRYPPSTLHAAPPLQYYEEPMRSALYAKVQGEANNKDGKIDFDVPGKLVGNWFLEGLPVNESARGEPEIWAKQLAFVHDVRRPDRIVISIGGTLAPAGLYQPDEGSADPSEVSPASGKINYRVRFSREGRMDTALLMVQMLANDRIQVEYFPDATAGPAEFTSAALVYVR